MVLCLEENMEYMISDMTRNGILKFNINFNNLYVVLEIEDAYVIYEVKYLSSKMSAASVNKEIEQIKNIRGLNVSKIGFINPNGFEMKLDDVLYVESIYEL